MTFKGTPKPIPSNTAHVAGAVHDPKDLHRPSGSILQDDSGPRQFLRTSRTGGYEICTHRKHLVHPQLLGFLKRTAYSTGTSMICSGRRRPNIS